MRISMNPCFLLTALLSLLTLAGCADLLPKGESSTVGAWSSYADAAGTFDRIIPYTTTVADLKALNLDPASNPNITLLNYSDLLRRFVPSAAIGLGDLDQSVRECLLAQSACRGLEINQTSIQRKRYGSFFADFLNFVRKTHVTGWRFNGMILIKDDKVIYKLTGGQPIVEEREESRNPLGPFQGSGESAARSLVD